MKCTFKNVTKNNTSFEHCSTSVLDSVVTEISEQLDVWTWALSCFLASLSREKMGNIYKRHMEVSQQDLQEKTKNKNGGTNDEVENVGQKIKTNVIKKKKFSEEIGRIIRNNAQ